MEVSNMENIQEVCNDIIKWLQDTVKDAGCKGLVFGLSGGIDSAVVAGLAKKAFPDDSIGIIMPCHSNPIDEEHAILVADVLELKTEKVELTNVFDEFISNVNDKESNKLAVSNVKPRLRMTTLYFFAQNNKYLVAGTSNKSEFTIGYFTKHGDSGVDILPIANFVKEEVRELARYLNIPEIIITKAPSAGLWEGQTDEKEMGFSYNDLDTYIRTGYADSEVKEKIEKMENISEHKRRFPLSFNVKE